MKTPRFESIGGDVVEWDLDLDYVSYEVLREKVEKASMLLSPILHN